MSEFTILFRDIPETVDYSGEYPVPKTLEGETDWACLGLDKYPIFDEDYRDSLNGSIFGAYLMREIGLETESLFRQRMIHMMRLQMPYFNKLYESERLKYDPLNQVSMHTTSVRQSEMTSDTETEGSSTAESTTKNKAVNSETPQDMLSGTADYATSASTADGAGSQSGDTRGTESVSANNSANDSVVAEGRSVSGQELVMAYRQSLINVDAMVIEYLSPLFMMLWGVGNEFMVNVLPPFTDGVDAYVYPRI